ncbi:hypothetical protein HYS28_01455 [Candidatus Uhrbacteria bacterium]|nr:hypothetical protein [Candidatus Uhrbacteria bacterium]
MNQVVSLFVRLSYHPAAPYLTMLIVGEAAVGLISWGGGLTHVPWWHAALGVGVTMLVLTAALRADERTLAKYYGHMLVAFAAVVLLVGWMVTP